MFYRQTRKSDINRPMLIIDMEQLKHRKILINVVEKYFPRYILDPSKINFGLGKRIFFMIFRFFIETLTKFLLKTPTNKVGVLDLQEVDEVYRREAKTYNNKHHLTTRGMDLVWRRNIGWFLAASNMGRTEPITVLDLCTGTGLTIKEICKILDQWSIPANLIGLDYNSEMLDIARSTIKTNSDYLINFVKGDAMDLVKNDLKTRDGITQFECNKFDYVVQMFGIGGIDKPIKEFYDILQILKPEGKFYLIDMHRPIPDLPGELPVLFKWLRFPSLEWFLYEKTTIPLVLNKLWGWRDTTLCFYFLNLVVYKDENQNYWAFEPIYFEYEPQRWWLSFPLMPTGKLIVKKVRITAEEAITRGLVLKSCKSSLMTTELV